MLPENGRICDETEKVAIILTEFPGLGIGYDVEILAEDASVGHYLEALDRWQQTFLAECKGCDGCCRERAPLTLPDFFNYQGHFPQALEIGHWLAWCGQVSVLPDGVLDILLKRGENGACFFLQEEEKYCVAHPYRPLVCHTHVCLPKSGRADELRRTLINLGEDALAAAWLAVSEAPAGVDPADYPLMPQLSKPWGAVLLSELLPDEIWRALFPVEKKKKAR